MKCAGAQQPGVIDRTPGFRRVKDVPDREIVATRDLVGGDEQALADELEVSLHGLRLRLSEFGDGDGGRE